MDSIFKKEGLGILHYDWKSLDVFIAGTFVALIQVPKLIAKCLFNYRNNNSSKI